MSYFVQQSQDIQFTMMWKSLLEIKMYFSLQSIIFYFNIESKTGCSLLWRHFFYTVYNLISRANIKKKTSKQTLCRTLSVTNNQLM